MTDDLGKDLKTAMAGIVPLYFAEAETESYPFCVYTRVIRERWTKEGVVDILSELTLEVVSDTYASAKDVADRTRTAVEALGSKYRIAFQSCEPTCEEGIWDFIIDYNIHQIQ